MGRRQDVLRVDETAAAELPREPLLAVALVEECHLEGVFGGRDSGAADDVGVDRIVGPIGFFVALAGGRVLGRSAVLAVMLMRAVAVARPPWMVVAAWPVMTPVWLSVVVRASALSVILLRPATGFMTGR